MRETHFRLTVAEKVSMLTSLIESGKKVRVIRSETTPYLKDKTGITVYYK